MARSEYRISNGSGFQIGRTPRDKGDAVKIAAQFNAVVLMREPDNPDDWIIISTYGGELLPRSEWRLSLW